MNIHHDHFSTSYHGLIEKEWLAHIFDLGNGAFQVERL
jgi:hypothetical protein